MNNKFTGVLISIIMFMHVSCFRNVKKSDEDLCRVEGTVSYKDDLIDGATVEIYSEGANDFDDPLIKVKAEKDGKFHAVLKPGAYYFIAKKTKDMHRGELKTGDLFCYYGGNPVNITGAKNDLVLKCVKTYSLEETYDPDLEQAELTGKIFDSDGLPLQNACVYLFTAENMDIKRMAECVSPPSSKDGEFRLSVEKPGRYFLVARKREDAREKGPLKVGDLYGYYHDNPLEIKDKTRIFLTVECLRKMKELENSGFAAVPSGKFAFKGRIIDKNGDPVKGVFAFAYKDEFRSGKKPDYKSMVTGEDGDYIIIIEQAGSYILGARKTRGGPPEPGDIFGFYNGSEKFKVEINKGTIDNIDIVVDEVK